MATTRGATWLTSAPLALVLALVAVEAHAAGPGRAARARPARPYAGLRAEAHRLLEANTRTGRLEDPATRRRFGWLRRKRPPRPTLRAALHRFTVPSTTRYPFQWFWDSCFHAIAWSHFDPDRGADELRSLMAWQRDDGFIPHVAFWNKRAVMTRLQDVWQYFESKPFAIVPGLRTTRGKPATTEQIQPPVLAQAVEQVVLRGRASRGRRGRARAAAFAREAVPKLMSYYRWLYDERDPDGDGLISIISPSESGLDFSRAYDHALGLGDMPSALALHGKMRLVQLGNKLRRYDSRRVLAADRFAVEDVLVNTIMIEGLAAMARVADEIGDRATARWARARRARSFAALTTKMWDPSAGLFFNLDGAAERRDDVVTIASVLPLILPDLPRDQVERLVERITAADGFGLSTDDADGLRFPLPHAPVSDPEFARNKDRRHWGTLRRNRRDTWVMTNWWLEKGLRQHGYVDLADALLERTVAMIDAAGFYEYFDPDTGKGMGATGFGWSTLVVDMIERLAERRAARDGGDAGRTRPHR